MESLKSEHSELQNDSPDTDTETKSIDNHGIDSPVKSNSTDSSGGKNKPEASITTGEEATFEDVDNTEDNELSDDKNKPLDEFLPEEDVPDDSGPTVDSGKPSEMQPLHPGTIGMGQVKEIKELCDEIIQLFQKSKGIKKKSAKGKQKKNLLERLKKNESFLDSLLSTGTSTETAQQIGGTNEDVTDIQFCLKCADMSQKYKDLEESYNEEKGHWQNDKEECERQLHDKQETIKDYSSRLAAEMGEKVASDESCFENVSIKTRPMNVGEEYSLILLTEWLSAKAALDECCVEATEQQKLTFLCDIIQVCEKTAQKTYGDVMTHVSKQFAFLQDFNQFCLKNWKERNPNAQSKLESKIPERQAMDPANEPTNDSDGQGMMACRSLNVLDPPVALTNVVGDILRRSMDTTDFSMFHNIVTNDVIEAWKSKEPPDTVNITTVTSSDINVDAITAKPEFRKYVHAMSELAWKMIIQRPQMRFDFTAERKDDKLQDLYWDSKVATESQVTLVYPILYHGDQLMVKGQIYLWSPQKNTEM